MILLGYVAWIGREYWPVSAGVTYGILAELSAEVVILYAVAIVGIVRQWRRCRG